MGRAVSEKFLNDLLEGELCRSRFSTPGNLCSISSNKTSMDSSWYVYWNDGGRIDFASIIRKYSDMYRYRIGKSKIDGRYEKRIRLL